MAVMLSVAKHLAFSVAYEDEILRLSPQDDIPTQSARGERSKTRTSLRWIIVSSHWKTPVHPWRCSGRTGIMLVRL